MGAPSASKEFLAFQSWRFTLGINQSAPSFNSQRSWWTWDHHGWCDDCSGGESEVSRRQKGKHHSKKWFDVFMNVVSLCLIELSRFFCSGSRDGVSWRSRRQSLVSLSWNSFLWTRLWALRCHVVLAVPRAFFVCVLVRCGSDISLRTESVADLVLFLLWSWTSKRTLLARFQNFANLASPICVYSVVYTRLDTRTTHTHYWYIYDTHVCNLSRSEKRAISAFRCNF